MYIVIIIIYTYLWNNPKEPNRLLDSFEWYNIWSKMYLNWSQVVASILAWTLGGAIVLLYLLSISAYHKLLQFFQLLTHIFKTLLTNPRIAHTTPHISCKMKHCIQNHNHISKATICKHLCHNTTAYFMIAYTLKITVSETWHSKSKSAQLEAHSQPNTFCKT